LGKKPGRRASATKQWWGVKDGKEIKAPATIRRRLKLVGAKGKTKSTKQTPCNKVTGKKPTKGRPDQGPDQNHGGGKDKGSVKQGGTPTNSVWTECLGTHRKKGEEGAKNGH